MTTVHDTPATRRDVIAMGLLGVMQFDGVAYAEAVLQAYAEADTVIDAIDANMQLFLSRRAARTRTEGT